MMKNIELKVKVDTLKSVRKKLNDISAQDRGLLHQVDTYLDSNKGRLKLREVNGEKFELIYYERADENGPKVSIYEIASFDAEGFEKVKKILSLAIGIKAVVKKERELWVYKNTRIHLDNVNELGEYVELETVVKDISMEQAKEEHINLINLLELYQYEKCKVSYSDLLISAGFNT